MADDDAAPEGELTEPTGVDEQSNAAEPKSAADEGSVEAKAEGSEAKADEASAKGAGDASEDISEDLSEDVSEDPSEDTSEEAAEPAKPRMSHVRLATIAGLVLVLALGGLTGWLGYRAYQSHQADEQRKLFLQVGRQGALNLTTIDWEQAEGDVQRVLDSATGTFYDDFEKRAQPFIEVVKQAQSKSEGTIAEAGLESESDDQARVLVAVTVQTSNAGAPDQQPRAWRMRLTVQKVGDDAKVSNVEFVP